MKTFREFFRTTVVGGLLVLAPLYLIVLLLLKALAGALALLDPILGALPAVAILRIPLAVGIMVGACFLAGLVIRTGPGARIIAAIQHQLLEKIPGYTMLRSLVARISGSEDGASTLAAALVEIEDALVPALVVEKLPGDEYVVMVPSVPTPFSGALYVLPAARVHHVDIPLRRLLQIYARWGEGTGEMVALLRRRQAGHRPGEGSEA
jgi:uncharacterized membrane protein